MSYLNLAEEMGKLTRAVKDTKASGPFARPNLKGEF
jgi:hypothetical protein